MTMRRVAVARALRCWRCRRAAKAARIYQGWVEADLIFVSPDEPGRVETLSVREGDRSRRARRCSRVDPDLQQADVEMAKASVTNATQALRARPDPAQDFGPARRRRSRTRKRRSRTAQARLASAQTRLARRKVFSPVTGSVQQIYFRPGELVPAGRPVVSILPPGNIKLRFFVPEPVLPQIALGEAVTRLRRLHDRC